MWQRNLNKTIFSTNIDFINMKSQNNCQDIISFKIILSKYYTKTIFNSISQLRLVQLFINIYMKVLNMFYITII